MKALKFLGIALLACGLMFTSCKKDNPQPSNNNTTVRVGRGKGLCRGHGRLLGQYPRLLPEDVGYD